MHSFSGSKSSERKNELCEKGQFVFERLKVEKNVLPAEFRNRFSLVRMPLGCVSLSKLLFILKHFYALSMLTNIFWWNAARVKQHISH